MNITVGKIGRRSYWDIKEKPTPRVRISNRLYRTDVDELLPRASGVIGRLASPEAVMRIVRWNEDSVWLLYSGEATSPTGFQASLLLNDEGRHALIDGRLDLFDPQPDYLCRQTERPALIYVWAVYAPGRTALALNYVVDRFASPHYADSDVAATVRTVAGARAISRLGFEEWSETGHENLVIVRRSAASILALRPRFNSFDPLHSPTGIKVVHSADEYFQVATIRAAVFVGEQSCPYGEEFDGNDFAATHLIAFVDGEPAGCMRIRFFGDCAKLERLAVRREFRSTRTSFNLVRASVALCREKGFRRLYGHARVDLLRFWQSFGFRVKENGKPFTFSDHSFVEMEHDIELGENAVCIDSGPYRTIRPEGMWHQTGILETSADRSG